MRFWGSLGPKPQRSPLSRDVVGWAPPTKILDGGKCPLFFSAENDLAKEPDPPLQPLRIPTGWVIDWNGFLEVDPIFDVGEVESIGFGEDLLQISDKTRSILLDLGWYPSGDPNGEYRLVAIRRHSDEDEMRASWDRPLRSLASRSRMEIVRVLEEWLWHFAHDVK
jgi:hypothetical protein